MAVACGIFTLASAIGFQRLNEISARGLLPYDVGIQCLDTAPLKNFHLRQEVASVVTLVSG